MDKSLITSIPWRITPKTVWKVSNSSFFLVVMANSGDSENCFLVNKPRLKCNDELENRIGVLREIHYDLPVMSNATCLKDW